MGVILTCAEGVCVDEAGMLRMEVLIGLVRRVWSWEGVRSLEWRGPLRYGNDSGQFFGLDMVDELIE